MKLKQGIEKIRTIKNALRQALSSKGVDMSNVKFEQYPACIDNLKIRPSGYIASDTYIATIDANSFNKENVAAHLQKAVALNKTAVLFLLHGIIPTSIYANLFAESILPDSIKKVSIAVADNATGGATSTYSMFHSCKHLTEVPMLDTSKVTSTAYMFLSCSSLVSIPALDTSNVTVSNSMFSGCSSLTSIPALNMSNMTGRDNYIFNGCTSLENIDAYGFKVSFSVSNTKLGAEALNKLFGNLATVTSSQTINITNTPGAATCDRSIATSKGWAVIG